MKLGWLGLVGMLVSGSFVFAGCGGDDDSGAGSSGKGGSSAGTGGSSAGKAGSVSSGGSSGKAGSANGGKGGSSAGKGAGGTSGSGTSVGGSNNAGAGPGGQSGEGGVSAGGTSSNAGAGAGAGVGGEGGAGGSSFDCSLPSGAGAPSITRNAPSGNPPTMTGGPIADGTYFQTSEDDYNGQDTESAAHRVLVFDQAAGRFAATATDSSNAVLSSSLVAGLTVASPTFTLSGRECSGNDSTLTIHYTATSTTFSLVDPNHADRVQNFAKQ